MSFFMKKLIVLGCGACMDRGYGCAGEWRCLKAATLSEGKFDEPSQVISFVGAEMQQATHLLAATIRQYD